MSCEEFLRACKDKFSFLVNELRFNPPVLAENNQWLCIVRYMAQFVAVDITLERRDYYIDVAAYRLIDGKMPDDSIRRQYKVSVRTLLDIRAPDVYPYPPGITGRILPSDEIEAILEKYAGALGQYGSDVLQGDFKILPEVQALLRSRMP